MFSYKYLTLIYNINTQSSLYLFRYAQIIPKDYNKSEPPWKKGKKIAKCHNNIVQNNINTFTTLKFYYLLKYLLSI